jgi:hypothetical protein
MALFYVFHVTDWDRLVAASEEANFPLFILFAALDKLIFFAVWTWVQVEIIRRFVCEVPRRSLIAVRGASEGFRALNNPLADAIFLVGTRRVTASPINALVAAALVPFVLHFLVLLAQATIILPLAPGGANAPGIHILIVLGWLLFAFVSIFVRASRYIAIPFLGGVRRWLDQLPLRQLAPFLGWFVALAFFDVLIQGLASRAFGVEIDWWTLAARLPLLYLALALPSVGNFGVREFAWSQLFENQASQDALVAYAFSTNALFAVFHVMIGAFFFRRAWSLLVQVRESRRRGEPAPRLRDVLRPPGESNGGSG